MQRIEAEWVWTEQGLRRDQQILVAADKIVGICTAVDQPRADIRLAGHLVVPGFVNAHSHAFQRAFRGHVQWREEGRDDFWSWRDAM